MGKKFEPAERYVRLRNNGSIYAATGAMATRANVDSLTPKQAAEAFAEAGVENKLTQHFKVKVDEDAEADNSTLASRSSTRVEPVMSNERDALLAEAEKLGIDHPKNIKTEALRKRINEARNEQTPGNSGGELGRDGGAHGQDGIAPVPGAVVADDENELEKLLDGTFDDSDDDKRTRGAHVKAGDANKGDDTKQAQNDNARKGAEGARDSKAGSDKK